ncbi:nitroreductase family protein [Paenibacillus cymbidii]|uniref:nitroreductase family protein n=1 Tax=Paenibacillus cymbidii TaxID=1639034 RepID=UPI00108065E1|nr:nitroreductase family protein [Paenibacillus cymbidii]
MNFAKTIAERRTIRKFKDETVPFELLNTLLKQASSLWKSEEQSHWRCVYYESAASRLRLAESMFAKVTGSQLGKFIPSKLTDFLTKSVLSTPVHLVFIAESAANRRQCDENYAAVCSIMQNLQLLGWENGLGMLWYTDPMLNYPSFFNEIGLKVGEKFAGILNIGYFDRSPKARKRTPAEQNWTEFMTDTKPRINTNDHYVSSPDILEIVNIAVWAPNDGLREPWRFIYVTDPESVAKLQPSPANTSPSFLIVVAKKEADPHKQEEDYAAVCCLIQNFQLLASCKGWYVRRTIPEWVYERRLPIPLNLDPQERTLAVLEVGTAEQIPSSSSTPSTLNVIRL